MASLHHIVYPRGDKSRLTVVEILDALDYELADYSVASKESFPDRKDAVSHAKELAKRHGKTFESSEPEDDYLDGPRPILSVPAFLRGFTRRAGAPSSGRAERPFVFFDRLERSSPAKGPLHDHSNQNISVRSRRMLLSWLAAPYSRPSLPT